MVFIKISSYKKIVSFILSLAIGFSAFPVTYSQIQSDYITATAASTNKYPTVIYKNGYYFSQFENGSIAFYNVVDNSYFEFAAFEPISSDEIIDEKIVVSDYVTYNGRSYPVKGIGKAAFNSKNVTSIEIGKNVEYIGELAFANCKYLKNVTINSTKLKTFDKRLFAADENLESITVAYGCPALRSVDGVLYTKDMKGLVCYPAKKADTYYSILDGVTEIYPYAFYFASNLNNIIIPEGVEHIGEYAFFLTQVKSFVLPASVKQIDEVALATAAENSEIFIQSKDCIFNDTEKTPIIIASKIYCYPGSTAETYAKSRSLPSAYLSTYWNDFQWGRDNWNFNNSIEDFPTLSTNGSQFNNNAIKKAFTENMRNTDYEIIFKNRTDLKGNVTTATINQKWNGSCFGMSSLVILAKSGLLKYDEYESNAKTLYELPKPVLNDKINSLLMYYHLKQSEYSMQQERNAIVKQNNKTIIQKMKEIITNPPENSNGLVLLGYNQDNFGHAAVAYGYREDSSFTWNGKEYKGCIYLCDPGHSVGYNELCNLYFDPTTYDWIIPIYNLGSATGGKIWNCISDISLLNDRGYLNGTAEYNAPNFTKLLVNEATGNYKISSGTKSPITKTNKLNIQGIYYDFSESESKVFDFTYNDNTADYFDTAFYDKDVYYLASSAKGKSVSYDTDKCIIKMTSEPSKFDISMTNNADYPTDWFTVRVSGNNASEVALEKGKDGYYLTLDKYDSVVVYVNNKEVSLSKEIGTQNLNKILLYEATDGSVMYKSVDNAPTTTTATTKATTTKTTATTTKAAATTTKAAATTTKAAATTTKATSTTKTTSGAAKTIYGDANEDKEVNIADATAIIQHLGNKDKYGLTEQGEINADIDGSVGVTGSDAIIIQQIEANMLSVDDLPLKK